MVERRYRSRTGWAAGVAEDAGGEDMPGRTTGDNGTLSTMAAAERAILVSADMRSPLARSRDGSVPKDGRAAGATLSAAAMVGTAVFRIVVSSDSMKNATATSQGNRRLAALLTSMRSR